MHRTYITRGNSQLRRMCLQSVADHFLFADCSRAGIMVAKSIICLLPLCSTIVVFSSLLQPKSGASVKHLKVSLLWQQNNFPTGELFTLALCMCSVSYSVCVHLRSCFSIRSFTVGLVALTICNALPSDSRNCCTCCFRRQLKSFFYCLFWRLGFGGFSSTLCIAMPSLISWLPRLFEAVIMMILLAEWVV